MRAAGRHEVVRRLERRRPHLEPRKPQQVGRERSDRSCAEHERALQLPRLPGSDRTRVPQRTLADRRGLGQDAERAERARDGDDLRRVLDDELAGEAVQPRDPALEVVARQARVRRAFRAGETVAAGAADDRGHQVAAREAVPVTLDPSEELVPEHQLALVVGRDAEVAVRDLAVGAAHADFQHADRHAVSRRLRHVGDVRRADRARPSDERLHLRRGQAAHACMVSRSTAPSEAEPTSSR